MVICSSREIALFEVIEVLKEAGARPGHRSDHEPSRRFISNLRLLSVSPTIKTSTGEPVWKLGVQFPWSERSELQYLPILEGAPPPKVGTYGAILEKVGQPKDTNESEEEQSVWKIITLESKAGNTPVVSGHMSKNPENTSNQPVQYVQKQVMSEREAELKAHVALKASTEMVSGYLASSGQFKKDYTWKDMVEIATTVADAFLLWIDDATERQLAQHSITQADAGGKDNADDSDVTDDTSKSVRTGPRVRL